MKKRLFSILLALCMAFCLVPTTAFAEGNTEDTFVCTCEAACTAETMNAECPVCGADGALAEDCGKCTEPAVKDAEPQPEGEKPQEKLEGDMSKAQSEAVSAQTNGEDGNDVAIHNAGVSINAANFPDTNFQNFVKVYDLDKDNYLSEAEIAAVTYIDCTNRHITNMTGIEYFTALQTLICPSNNGMTVLDVTKNTALTYLECYNNGLPYLDVTKNTALTYLNCYNNNLTNLDVTKNTQMKTLNCGENRLTSLDVTKNTALEYLTCTQNALAFLDITKNTALKELICSSNKLTALDVTKNTTLTRLDCQNNALTNLDISNNNLLEILYCNGNQLVSLDISNNKALKELYCFENQLTSLDVNRNTALKKMECYDDTYGITVGKARTFDLSKLPGSFDVSKASNWKGGTVNGNILTVDNDKDTVTYTYDCGNGKTANFTLKCTQVIQGLNLYVNGEQFTSEDLSIACGEGTATYDPDTKTLTLNNATITNGGKSDENPKYGIRVVGDTDLTIKLSGTNSITLANGGGIFADGSSDNYNIIGDGKLTIDVRWDALYTLNGNINISEGAELDIKSAEGNGIMSYNKGNISIDGAKVKSFAYYSAANAKELEVKNASEVVLNSSADYFNAAYMGDENGAGKIEIINSNVEATSYYPALYTEGKLTVNGGEVKCTSTADAAIWTRGDILIKGGAKVTTDGKYPMGGYGTFTVEEAEVDAKNTNTDNIPAIFDECIPVIADGYQLTYAKAVDSEGTAIDLLSSGTQYFALYKNVHFMTKAAYPVSFVVTPDGLTNVVVKVNGQVVTNPVNLVAGTYQIEVTADNCKAYSGNITISADAATHTQMIAMTYLPADYTKVDKAIDKANELNKDNYKDISAVEAAVKAVVRDKNITEQAEVDAMAKAIEDAIAALVYKDADYTKVDEAIAKAESLKKDNYKDFTGVESAVKAVVRGKNITEQSEVDAMAKAIEEAIAALVYKDADYTKVDEAIAKAESLKKDDYKDFTGVESAVKGVVRGKNITEQSEVDKMAKAIEDAIAALEKKTASTKPGTSVKSPQTGDTSNLVLWIVLLFVSGSVTTGAVILKRKKKYTA